MRHTYLQEHKKAYYTTLLFDGRLVAHLNEIDDAANTQMELITKQMATSQGITEALKWQYTFPEDSEYSWTHIPW